MKDDDIETEKEEEHDSITKQKIDAEDTDEVQEHSSNGMEEKNESAVDRFTHNTKPPREDFHLDVRAATPVYTAVSDIYSLNSIDPRFTLCASKCSYVPN